MVEPGARVHSVQIEINRGLYLDEVRVERTPGFESLRHDLASFSASLLDAMG